MTAPLFQQVDARPLNGETRDIAVSLADEVPVRLVFNGLFAHGVMMMTPDSFEDFAYGYCLTEGIAPDRGEIRSVTVVPGDDGFTMDIALNGPALSRFMKRRPRAQTGNTSCGICGEDDVPSVGEAGMVPLPPGPFVSRQAIGRGLEALPAAQTLNARTRMVHAAAWADGEGRIRTIREDVGRHNALDKLIGARIREGAAEDGFCLLTSRYSYEMALKTLRARMAVVVAVSAPTLRALRLAQTGGQTLIAIARHDSQRLFCGRERLVA